MDPVPECRALRDPMPSPRAVARTYGTDRDGWDRVLDYHSVARYTAEHPDAGSTAVATALDMPRGRVRPWLGGNTAPDPVRGLRTALDRGWIVEEHDRVGRIALAVATTWIAAGGSVEQTHDVPLFSAQTTGEQERLETVAEDLDIDLAWIDRDDEGQGIEAKPSTDASIFGRVLLAAGAASAPTDPLPAWILDGDEQLRRAAAACYVDCRGQRAGNAGLLQIREEVAGAERLESIGELLASVAGAGSWTISGEQVRLDAEATGALIGTLDVEI